MDRNRKTGMDNNRNGQKIKMLYLTANNQCRQKNKNKNKKKLHRHVTFSRCQTPLQLLECNDSVSSNDNQNVLCSAAWPERLFHKYHTENVEAS